MEVYVLEIFARGKWEIREVKTSKLAMDNHIKMYGERWQGSGLVFRVVPYVADYSRVETPE